MTATTPTFTEITIPDPAEVLAALIAELPDCLYRGAAYEATPDRGKRWILTHCDHAKKGCPVFYGYGETPEAALADLRNSISAFDPLLELGREAEKHGMKLVPA